MPKLKFQRLADKEEADIGLDDFNVENEWLDVGLYSPKKSKPRHRPFKPITMLMAGACTSLIVISGIYILFATRPTPSSSIVNNNTTTTTSIPIPPVAQRRPTTIIVGNDTVVHDDYGWLKFRNDVSVTSYIQAENDYTTSMMASTVSLQQKLVSELQGWKAQSSYSSLPCGVKSTSVWEAGEYVYWISEDGSYMRKALPANSSCSCPYPDTGNSELVLNPATIPHNTSSYFSMGIFEVTSLNLLAYSVDLVGNEAYTIHLVNLTSHERMGPDIHDTYYSVRWFREIDPAAGERDVIYYNVMDSLLGIPNRIYRYNLDGITRGTGRMQGEELVYYEPDYRYTAEVDSTNDGRYILIKVSNLITSEIRIRGQTSSIFQTVFTRQEGVKYDIEHRNGYLYIRTNAGNATEYQVIRVPVADVLAGHQPPYLSMVLATAQVVLAHNSSQFIERIEVFSQHMVAWVWVSGLRSMVIVDLESLAATRVAFASQNPATQVYSVMPSSITDMESRLYRRYNTSCLSYSNSSYLQPRNIYTLDLNQTGIPHTLIAQDIVTGYNLSDYAQDRFFTTSAVKVPVSLLRKRKIGTSDSVDITLYKARPLLMLAYGAYGSFIETAFTQDYFPLLDRGVIIALCHPRGDGDMGAKWYEDGRRVNKTNTFVDVHSCLNEVVARGMTEPGLIALKGRSAGGLVAGVAVNEWGYTPNAESGHIVKAVVAQVPFIDVLGDLADEAVPWTPYEWSEWGNPNNPSDLSIQLQYSPYENIVNGSTLPALYVSTGMNDGRVPYYEPVKWIAKLRTTQETVPTNGVCRSNTTSMDDARPLLLRVDAAGHFGGSGDVRIAALAEWYAFVLCQLNVADCASYNDVQANATPLVAMGIKKLTFINSNNFSMERRIIGPRTPTRRPQPFGSISGTDSTTTSNSSVGSSVTPNGANHQHQNIMSPDWTQIQEQTPPPSANVSLIHQAHIVSPLFEEHMYSADAVKDSQSPFPDLVADALLQDLLRHSNRSNSSSNRRNSLYNERFTGNPAYSESNDSVLSTTDLESVDALNDVYDGIFEARPASDTIYDAGNDPIQQLYPDLDMYHDPVEDEFDSSSSPPLTPSIETVEAPTSPSDSLSDDIEPLVMEFDESDIIEGRRAIYHSALNPLGTPYKAANARRLLFHGPPSPETQTSASASNRRTWSNEFRMARVLQSSFALEQGVAELEQEISAMSNQIDALKLRQHTEPVVIGTQSLTPSIIPTTSTNDTNNSINQHPSREKIKALLRGQLQRVLISGLDISRGFNEHSESGLSSLECRAFDDVVQSHIATVGLCLKLFDKM
ncbi:hypothetical protein SmJEL517_g03589 [Synchytrium microbalum]|uniref:Prolyl endopeptidase-like n=1 Tax=Synchytrium microbalum TaxID=1806994 RepID=A0A507C2F3_9FUNG|nr:uncharacterized protein SmJEL517_g03589 [Synchytrium microbalum]TPX33601.1 hypothetical protein SmJEL517_g03589 [Synchytrium microbalum]